MTTLVFTSGRASTLLVILLSVGVGAAVAFGGTVAAAALLATPLAVLILARLTRFPDEGLYLALLAAFVGAGLSRYVLAPTGLLVDGFLFVTALILVLTRSGTKRACTLRNTLVIFVGVWFIYNVGQLFNPERPSVAAWFYAVRGIALYWLLAIPAALLLFKPARDLNRFLKWWLILSLIGTAWGFKQLLIGLDPAEEAWLAVPGNQTTHLLFGKLRVFSFYSDTGQFGAAQGHAAVVAGILAVGARRIGVRILLGASSAILLVGLLISGTRGAVAVPFVGFLTYLLLSKNWRTLLFGLITLTAVFSLLKYTYVGHNVYEIQRMRTAILQGSDNPSLQVRFENQKRLATYLEDRPFGGGVGSAGYWGQRFSPDTFLANLALDSWYVKIWAEQGVVGLILYMGFFLFVLYRGLRRLLSVTNEEHRHKLLALFCGIIGVLVASYGNQVLGQMPTGIIVAFSLTFLFIPEELSDPEQTR